MNSLITNKQTNNFYNHLTQLLLECKAFYFNVAFINFSGVQLLLDSLKQCEQKGVRGKILTSTYLNFTEPKALKRLKEFRNIELNIFDCEAQNIGFHAKSYIFEYEDEYKILLGSSNITASAFKTNIEWNIKTVSKKDEEFSKEILKEFSKLFKQSIKVDEEFLNSYEVFYKSLQKESKKFVYKKELKINKMQKEALQTLRHLRKKGEKKALVIAATGTGKTYLSAFDVKNFGSKTILFLVHRQNILLSAKKSFENIIEDVKFEIFSNKNKQENAQAIFCTIQTMSLHYKSFKKEQFDYIIVDEAHHITSPSYEKVIDYFKPKFLLGLTATPNRSDEKSIYEIFDNNIACDIKLNDAMEHKLVVPFHYFGIEDIKTVDYEKVDLNKIDEVAKLLKVNKRVDYIIKKMNYYGFYGQRRKVLAFCASKEHCIYMSEEFNKKGICSTYLTSESRVLKREESIKKLEDENDSLEVIFTVDIFNEGIDIPSVNMVLFLRPTNSSIVFAQQLGRGLRKAKNKEFLTVLDFIGNHQRAYLIVLALVGNKIIDKESLKIALLNNFSSIHNAFISMDSISKQRILEQINKENFNSLKYLKEQYLQVKRHLGGKVPMLVDFLEFEEFISPIKFINSSKSYIEFLAKAETKGNYKEQTKNETFIKAIRFVQWLLPIKRVYEFIVLKYLLSNDFCDEDIIYKKLQKYQEKVHKDTIKHSFSYLNQEFFDVAQKSRYLKLVSFDGKEVVKTKEFEKLLEDKTYKTYFEDSLDYGILHYEKTFGVEDYKKPFLKLYEKYNMLNIAQLCNFPKIHSSFRGSGFLKYEDDFFLFINLQKEKFSKSSRYENAFLSKDTFTYESKPSMSSSSGDGLRLVENKKYKVKLHIFVRKYIQVDKQTQSFIYLGLANTLEYKENKPIKLKLRLEKSLNDNLYEEFTKIV